MQAKICENNTILNTYEKTQAETSDSESGRKEGADVGSDFESDTSDIEDISMKIASKKPRVEIEYETEPVASVSRKKIKH
ncbi:jg17666 [Pararge aegeria aegeria]|uniref:Jg17666 protein n=1 Tax=Pararge aegeria aegeria TaxID=348720 RepID=A0A8S4RK08_9NEOP|nr:jg17666 [Pararge aegeria aegeria]